MANGVDCTVLSPARGDSTPSLPEGATLELVTEPRMGLLQIRLGRLVRPLGRLRSGPFAERVRVLARDADVVHFVEAEAAATIDLVERPAVAQLHCLTRKDPRVWNPLRHGGRN